MRLSLFIGVACFVAALTWNTLSKKFSPETAFAFSMLVGYLAVFIDSYLE